MKKLNFILIVALIFFSCEKNSILPEDCMDIEYDEAKLAKYKDKFCLENGYSFEISNVEENLCPCPAICLQQWSFRVGLLVTDPSGESHKLLFSDFGFDKNLDKFIPTITNITHLKKDCTKKALPEEFSFDIIIKEK